MVPVDVNFAAVITAALMSMVVGAFWYSPLLFANEWSRLVGKTAAELRARAKNAYPVAAIGALLQAYILAHFVQYAAATTAIDGAVTGFWLWLGFVAVTSAINSVFAARPWGLWRIDSAYFLVVLLLNGAILAVWQ